MHLVNLECGFSKAVTKISFTSTNTKSMVMSTSHGPLDTARTHIFLAEMVHLSEELLLAVRVRGQEVGGEGEGVGDDLVASDEKEEGLAHDLVRSQRLGREPGLVFLGRIR